MTCPVGTYVPAETPSLVVASATADQTCRTGDQGPRSPPARLKSRGQFLAVAKGKRFHAGPFSLQGLRRNEAEPATGPRFGLTVTRQTGNSVERNRIRRRLREVLRLRDTGGKPDHDYVIVARRSALSLPFDRLAEELTHSMTGLHGRKENPSGARRPRKSGQTAIATHKDQAAKS